MSISSMTNVAIARRTDDLGHGGRVPRRVHETAAATGGKAETESAGSAALKAIVTYIPTETITLYVAALAAVRAGSAVNTGARASVVSSANTAQLATFFGFLGFTPILVWLVYAGKVKTAGKTVPVTPRKWPVWEMASSLVAFAAWAYTLPDSPFSRFGWYTEALGTFVVLVTSTVLGLIAPIVQRPLKA
jgi:hypothetical protein